ncbi:TonB-dependent siderophore receptor [Pseudomonas benzenivorans]|uniref:TonB-dependent siderophore receptor n=1 Tax=Pseudomonas benzenivorans TaxID=556533 RepID=A0ABZ0PZ56_9PSED|nr:TonB-dependent siderophore receptor [Pseudomonas benzenivorans]WPC06498.1 TonB-dependent siderophore receptor [Pseudomonas benzenivorans]
MQGLSKYPSRAPFARCRLSLALGCALALSAGLARAADGVTELESMEITGKLSSPVTDDSGYVAKNSRSATKINTPLRETPRSVSVVTEQQMKDRNVLTVSDALRYSAGIQAGYFGEDNKQDWFVIRGFKQANNGLFMDGARVFSSGFFSWQIDPYMLERIEVLKGASSVLYGQTPPGGLINLQSKRPTLAARNEIGVQYGSFDRKQMHMDVGGKLDDDGDLLYRVVALSRDTGTQVDDVGAERLLLAPSLTINFNPDTSLTLLASVQKDNSDPQLQFLPASGTIAANPNGKIDTDTAVGDPGYEKFDRTQLTLGYELNHRFSDAWEFQQNLRYGHLDLELRQLYSLGFVNDSFPGLDPSRRLIARGLTYEDGQAESLSVDNRMLGNWIGNGWENNLLLGFDYQLLNIDTKSPASDPGFPVVPLLDIYNPKRAAPVTLPMVGTITPTYGQPIGAFALQDKDTRADQFGYYLQEQLKLDDHWVFTLGGRYDETRYDFDNRTTGAGFQVSDQQFTASGGVAYLFDNGLTPYASYSEFFTPVTSLNTSTGKPFMPEEGEQKEIGLKFQPQGFSGLFTMALFELTQDNVRKTLPGGIQTQLGQVRSRGLELEAQADLSESLSLVASYTKLDVETTKSTRPTEVGKTPANVADELASIWAHYKVKGGSLDGLAFGAGARHTSSSYGDNTESLEVPSYTLLDAVVSYDWENFRVQLNANNLTDKEYITACDYYCWYGNRRNVIASVNYAW